MKINIFDSKTSFYPQSTPNSSGSKVSMCLKSIACSTITNLSSKAMNALIHSWVCPMMAGSCESRGKTLLLIKIICSTSVLTLKNERPQKVISIEFIDIIWYPWTPYYFQECDPVPVPAVVTRMGNRNYPRHQHVVTLYRYFTCWLIFHLPFRLMASCRLHVELFLVEPFSKVVKFAVTLPQVWLKLTINEIQN